MFRAFPCALEQAGQTIFVTHFTDEEVEVQRGWGMCLGNQLVSK